MSGEASPDLERRLHALWCGDLAPAEARDELARLCRDEQARAVLAEMIEVQQACRAALGCEVGEEAVRQGVGSLAPLLARRERGRASERFRRVRRWRGALRWMVRAAALLVVGGSVYVAVSAHWTVTRMGERLEEICRTVTAPQVSAAELAMYREMLRQVADPAGQSRPWLLFADGEGEFGYLPAVSSDASSSGPILVRCLLVADDGSRRQMLTLVVPSGRQAPLTLPEAARWDDMPIDLDVAAQGRWADVGLTVGEHAAGASGVRGRVGVGEPPSEVGQFRLRSRPVRVFLQAVLIGQTVG